MALACQDIVAVRQDLAAAAAAGTDELRRVRDNNNLFNVQADRIKIAQAFQGGVLRHQPDCLPAQKAVVPALDLTAVRQRHQLMRETGCEQLPSAQRAQEIELASVVVLEAMGEVVKVARHDEGVAIVGYAGPPPHARRHVLDTRLLEHVPEVRAQAGSVFDDRYPIHGPILYPWLSCAMKAGAPVVPRVTESESSSSITLKRTKGRAPRPLLFAPGSNVCCRGR